MRVVILPNEKEASSFAAEFIENFITTVNIILNDQKRMYVLSKNIQDIFPPNAINLMIEDSLKFIK